MPNIRAEEVSYTFNLIIATEIDGQVVADALDSAMSSIDSNLWELGFPQAYTVTLDGQVIHEFKGE